MSLKSLGQIIFLLITLHFSFLEAQNYDLNAPKESYVLPSILREVSGITITNKDQLVCIQDELGLLFMFSTKTKDLAGKDSFYVKGDFEGIASVGNDLYVLRSDGAIIEVKKPFTKETTTQTYLTGIPAMDNEGLCYDEENNQLLILSKSMSTAEDASVNQRMIYAFDLTKKTLSPNPFMVIDVSTIHDFLINKYQVSSTSDIHMNPSEIAIHPITGKIYVLSADAYLLCVFKDGVFESAEMLDKNLFYKAEGICFLSNGDMIISNEGPRKGKGNLLLFKYSKK